jgi:hypothetical protein
MNFELMKSSPVFVEIGPDSLALLDGERGIELPVERTGDGVLTAACRERITTALAGFFGMRSAWLRRRAWCAIGARGVSLRRLALPPAPESECERLLALQIEGEFPLPPEELAWGSRSLAGGADGRAGSGNEWLVAAVKKELLADYAAVLSACGLNPVFTLGAMVRHEAVSVSSASGGVLDIGRHQSELTLLEHGTPVSVRVLPWGNARSADAASPDNPHGGASLSAAGEPPQSGPSADGNLPTLAGMLRSCGAKGTLHVTGTRAAASRVVSALNPVLAGGLRCEIGLFPESDGHSAAILGLKKTVERGDSSSLLTLRTPGAQRKETTARPTVLPWAALACLLAAGALSLRYAESFLWKSTLAKRLAELKSQQNGLPKIDRELDFLQQLDRSRPPFLDALVIIANATAPGVRAESFSINQRGDIALKLSMQNPQQAVDFRAKLIDSAFFTSVIVEEQTPIPNRQQQVNVRITAQCKPSGARPPVTATNSPPVKGGPPKS